MLDLPPPDPAIEFVISSRGISKGLAQTDDEPQLLMRGELAFGAFQLGGYIKNVTSTSSDGEAAASIGFRKKLAGFDVAAQAAWKRALDPADGFDRNALEMNGSIAGTFGALTPRLSVVWSPDDLGSTRKTVFAEAGAAYKATKRFTVSGAVGRRERSGGVDYTAWNAGAAWALAKPVTLDLRYYDTNGGGSHPFRARLVGSIRAKF